MYESYGKAPHKACRDRYYRVKGEAAVKERNILDILGNAEEDTMEFLTEKCPEITDAELDALIDATEKKYKTKKKAKDGTEKDNNINMTENEVSGVEHSRRPAWLAPLLTAASIVLTAGVVLGSVMLLNRHGHNGGGIEQPAVTATTTSVTAAVSTIATSAGTATGTAAMSTATTQTVTAAETTAETTVYTTVPFVAPAAEKLYVDNELGSIALELFKKDDEVRYYPMGGGIECDIHDGIKFAADPELDIWCFDYSVEGDSYPAVHDIAYYCHVTDSKFSSLEEIKNYARRTMSENRYEQFFGGKMAKDIDDLEYMDTIDKEHTKFWIEYRGKLYELAYVGGWGKLPSVFSDFYPVIIADKTDTSYTAYIPLWYIQVEDINNCICVELKLILDPEFNDWRVDNVEQFDGKHYEELYNMLKG